MTVLVLTAVPPGLRGHLTRWLLEISPGVFVGHISARVREEMWRRVVEFVGDGRAIMVHSKHGEQRLAFQVHGHDWTPADHDGVVLMRRPAGSEHVSDEYTAGAAPSFRRWKPPGSSRASGISSEAVWKRREKRRKFKRK